MQYRVRWADGSLHWLESEGKSEVDAQGKVTRIFGVMADITRRKQADEALLRAEKLAVAGRLAASVAHEINNPMEAVANILYLISTTDSVEEARMQASGALDELMRIALVAQSTLKFHREIGTPKDTLLSEVMESVLSMFRGKLQAMEIDVETRVDGERPINCMLSETQQIFANLVANAIEAMDHHGRLVTRIRPSRDWRDRTTRGMRVTICDTGAGVDRATLGRMFEPFFTTKTETGTGLGLWVVAQLLERHKGSVRVWSSQREGACGAAFSVFLPYGDATENRPSSEDGAGTAADEPMSETSETCASGPFSQHQYA
jgi:two-component system CheB/CheR fusion protein